MNQNQFCYTGGVGGILKVNESFISINPHLTHKLTEPLPPCKALVLTTLAEPEFNLFSYKYFSQDIPIICPLGTAKLINRFLHNPVIELSPGQSHKVDSFRIGARLALEESLLKVGMQTFPVLNYLIETDSSKIFIASFFHELLLMDGGLNNPPDLALLFAGEGHCGLWKRTFMTASQIIKAASLLGANKILPLDCGKQQKAWLEIEAKIKGQNVDNAILKPKLNQWISLE